MISFWVWIAVIVIAVILEAATPIDLVSIWAALGGACALIAYFFGANDLIQIIVFFVVTLIAILATRPLAKRLTSFDATPTNSDRCIGKTGIVLKQLNNDKETFIIKLGSEEWSAICEDKTIPEKGTEVVVVRIEGVKLVVEPVGFDNLNLEK